MATRKIIQLVTIRRPTQVVGVRSFHFPATLWPTVRREWKNNALASQLQADTAMTLENDDVVGAQFRACSRCRSVRRLNVIWKVCVLTDVSTRTLYYNSSCTFPS